jgi:hypothetical protein
METTTFEQVDAHIEKHYSAPAMKKAIDKKKLADIYKVARPALVLVSSLPILPKKWKQIITDLISVLDLITAGGDEPGDNS